MATKALFNDALQAEGRKDEEGTMIRGDISELHEIDKVTPAHDSDLN